MTNGEHSMNGPLAMLPLILGLLLELAIFVMFPNLFNGACLLIALYCNIYMASYLMAERD